MVSEKPYPIRIIEALKGWPPDRLFSTAEIRKALGSTDEETASVNGCINRMSKGDDAALERVGFGKYKLRQGNVAV